MCTCELISLTAALVVAAGSGEEHVKVLDVAKYVIHGSTLSMTERGPYVFQVMAAHTQRIVL